MRRTPTHSIALDFDAYAGKLGDMTNEALNWRRSDDCMQCISWSRIAWSTVPSSCRRLDSKRYPDMLIDARISMHTLSVESVTSIGKIAVMYGRWSDHRNVRIRPARRMCTYFPRQYFGLTSAPLIHCPHRAFVPQLLGPYLRVDKHHLAMAA
jgi:hypothetical protein